MNLKADIQCTACREVFTLEFNPDAVSMGERHLVDRIALQDKVYDGYMDGWGNCDFCGSKHYVPELWEPIDIALEELRV